MFSQFFLNSLDLNPAAAGSVNDGRLFLHYRNQFPGAFQQTFTTYQVSYDRYIKKMNGGLGVNLLRDNIGGGMVSNNLDFIYSYRTKINQNLTLQSGLQASLMFSGVSTSGLTVIENDIVSNQSTQPDFALGFLGMTRNSQTGFSIHHLNSGYIKFNYSFIKTPLKINFFYSRNISIYNRNKVQPKIFVLTPAVMVQKQGGSIMLNYGSGFTFGNVIAGVWVRNNLPFQISSIIFSTGFTFSNLNFCYSYDFQLPSLDNYMPATGAHEITMTLRFPTDPKKGRYRPVKCPDVL